MRYYCFRIQGKQSIKLLIACIHLVKIWGCFLVTRRVAFFVELLFLDAFVLTMQLLLTELPSFLILKS